MDSPCSCRRPISIGPNFLYTSIGPSSTINTVSQFCLIYETTYTFIAINMHYVGTNQFEGWKFR